MGACTPSYLQFEKNYQSLNVTDGIDKNEALIIAYKKFHEHKDAKYYRRHPRTVETKASHWVVVFSSKIFSINKFHRGQYFYVVIDRQTGTVLRVGSAQDVIDILY